LNFLLLSLVIYNSMDTFFFILDIYLFIFFQFATPLTLLTWVATTCCSLTMPLTQVNNAATNQKY